MNQEVFKQSIAFLQNYYNYAVPTDVIINIYWPKLKGLDDEVFKTAVSRIIDTFVQTATVKFPTIPHFLEALGMDSNTKARTAINAVRRAIEAVGRYDSIDFGDSALHETIMSYGGWPSVCNWSDDDWRFKETAFADTYKAFLHGFCDCRHLVGIAEAENSLGGYKIKKPVRALLPWGKPQYEIENAETEENEKLLQEITQNIKSL